MKGALFFNRLTSQWSDVEGNPVHVHFERRRSVAATVEGRTASAALFSHDVDMRRAQAERRRRDFVHGAPFRRSAQS